MRRDAKWDRLRIDGGRLTVRGCRVLANTSIGIEISGNVGTVDLGNMASPGGNVLQSADAALANGDAGVCMRTSLSLPAQGNHWMACPPSLHAGGCTGGFDIAWPGTTAPVADTTGCLSP